ncbi:MAG: sulfatase family protein [Candidatus Krumholzibacteriia bacterium]
MPRRVLAFALGLVLVLAITGVAARSRSREPRLPDVIMIAIDTLRSDHLHCYGNDWIRTPNLDALARDGVRFSRCFATAPWTLPSFASIFTGLTPGHHGAVGGAREVLDDSRTTLAERLAAAGYRTYGYATVKWLTPPFGMARGFNFELPLATPAGLEGGPLVTALGRATFDLPRDKPLFTFLHYFDAHAPYAPPPPFARMYYHGDERAPGAPVLDFLRSPANAAPNRSSGMYDWLAGVTDLEFPAREYAAAVSYTDDHVGRIVAELKRSGRYDDALIIVVADHGEHLGEHDLWFTHALPYQEALHVPLIVKLPRGHAAGRLVETPVSTLDILPTVLDWLGLPAASPCDGRSLQGLVEGRDRGGPSLLVAEQGSEPDDLSKSLIDWPWKLNVFRSRAGDRYELYDLGRDPGERHDLAAQRPSELARLSARLWTVFEEQHPLGFGAASGPADLDAAAQRQLRSLGYLTGRAAEEPAAPGAPGAASDPRGGRAGPSSRSPSAAPRARAP